MSEDQQMPKRALPADAVTSPEAGGDAPTSPDVAPTNPTSSKAGVRIIVALVAALAVGAGLQPLLPKADDVRNAPFERNGAVGDEINYRLGTIKVTDVSAAKEVQYIGSIAGTEGVWLIVDVDYTPKREPSTLTGMEIRDPAGNTYGGSQALAAPCSKVQTNMTFECEMLIELPPSALEGAQARFPATLTGPSGPDDIVVVDLGIDAAKADQLVANAGRVKWQEPKAKERP